MTREEFNRLMNTVFSTIRQTLPDEMDFCMDDLCCTEEDVADVTENLIVDIKDNIFADDYVD
jgi:hypothetical protein